jgi:hypothetical protein
MSEDKDLDINHWINKFNQQVDRATTVEVEIKRLKTDYSACEPNSPR